MKHWRHLFLAMLALCGCDSVALQVNEVHVIELQALTPYLESDKARYTVKLLAPTVSQDLKVFSSSEAQPLLLNYGVDPFEFRSQAFENDFEMTVVLDRLDAVEPGQRVELYFEIENVHGFFELYANVEFY